MSGGGSCCHRSSSLGLGPLSRTLRVPTDVAFTDLTFPLGKLPAQLREILLGMGADLSGVTRGYVGLHLLPVLPIQSECLHKPVLFFLGPTAVVAS